MKLAIALLIFVSSINLFASEDLGLAIECHREVVAKALETRIKNATLAELNSSEFSYVGIGEEINEPEIGLIAKFDYFVDIDAKRRNDGSIQTTSYGVKLVDVKKCEVTATEIAK